MLNVNIPGFKNFEFENIVFDFNGTLAKDGKVDVKLLKLIRKLSEKINVYVLSADTYGNVRSTFSEEPVKVIITSKENGTLDKMNFINEIGNSSTIAVGNGRIDSKMLEVAALSIAILGDEGAARLAILASDIIVKNPIDAVELLLNPNRLIATLRGY